MIQHASGDASRFDTSSAAYKHGAVRVLHSKEGPFEGEGTEKDVSLSGSHFKRLERTPSDEDKSYPQYETLNHMNFKSEV